jgi:hypothetical protein
MINRNLLFPKCQNEIMLSLCYLIADHRKDITYHYDCMITYHGRTIHRPIVSGHSSQAIFMI